MMKLHRWLYQAVAKGSTRNFVQTTRTSNNNNGTTHPSAGIIVIGNELLKAQVKDTNCFHACTCLYKLGVNVKKISVIGDNVYDIAREIKDFSERYKYVITSGGIGPTHDDVTFEALAMAFNDKLHRHPTLVESIKNIFRDTGNSSAYKMAEIPTKATLKFGTVKGKQLGYPCVVMNNVHVFPGSPPFFLAAFNSIYKELFPSVTDFHTTELFINAMEVTFANTLTSIAKEFPRVSFGSYPEYSRYYKVRITIESNSVKETEAAASKLRAAIPTEVLTNHDRSPHVDCLTKFENFIKQLSPTKRELYSNTFNSMLTFHRRPRRVAVFFDGSPESIILIHLARTVLSKAGLNEALQVVCFEGDVENPELGKFLQILTERYRIDTIHETYRPNLSELVRNLAFQKNNLKVLLVGSRKTDITTTLSDKLAALEDDTSLKVQSPLFDWTKADIDTISTKLSLPYFERAD